MSLLKFIDYLSGKNKPFEGKGTFPKHRNCLKTCVFFLFKTTLSRVMYAAHQKKQ